MGDIVNLTAHRIAKAAKEHPLLGLAAATRGDGARLRRVADLESDISEIESWEPLVDGSPPFSADRLRDLATEARTSSTAAFERAELARPVVSQIADRQDAVTQRIANLASVCATLDALEPLSSPRRRT